MGQCRQLAPGIRSCQCDKGYVGKQCQDLMVTFDDYVRKHPEAKNRIKQIAKKNSATKEVALSKAVTVMNQRFFQWSKNQYKKDLKAKKKEKKKKQKSQSQLAVHNAFQKAFGAGFNMALGEVEVDLNFSKRKKRAIAVPYEQQVLCINSCKAVFALGRELCPDNNLAVELRIEDHPWHGIPMNRVTCCSVTIGQSCDDDSEAVVAV